MSRGSRNEPGFDDFKGDIEDAERRVAREIDPGARALVVAVLVFVILLSFVLPHTGSARGLDVLVGDDAAIREAIALPSRVFTWLILVFSVGFSILALTHPPLGPGLDRAGRFGGGVPDRHAGGVVASDGGRAASRARASG